MVRHQHIPEEQFAFLGNVNALALDYTGVKLLQKVMDGTISVQELALLREIVTKYPPAEKPSAAKAVSVP